MEGTSDFEDLIGERSFTPNAISQSAPKITTEDIINKLSKKPNDNQKKEQTKHKDEQANMYKNHQAQLEKLDKCEGLSELHTHLLGMGSDSFWVDKVMMNKKLLPSHNPNFPDPAISGDLDDEALPMVWDKNNKSFFHKSSFRDFLNHLAFFEEIYEIAYLIDVHKQSKNDGLNDGSNWLTDFSESIEWLKVAYKDENQLPSTPYPSGEDKRNHIDSFNKLSNKPALLARADYLRKKYMEYRFDLGEYFNLYQRNSNIQGYWKNVTTSPLCSASECTKELLLKLSSLASDENVYSFLMKQLKNEHWTPTISQFFTYEVVYSIDSLSKSFSIDLGLEKSIRISMIASMLGINSADKDPFETYIIFNSRKQNFECVKGIMNSKLQELVEEYEKVQTSIILSQKSPLRCLLENAFTMKSTDANEPVIVDLLQYRGKFTPEFYPRRFALKDCLYEQRLDILAYLLYYVLERYSTCRPPVNYVEFSFSANDLSREWMLDVLKFCKWLSNASVKCSYGKSYLKSDPRDSKPNLSPLWRESKEYVPKVDYYFLAAFNRDKINLSQIGGYFEKKVLSNVQYLQLIISRPYECLKGYLGEVCNSNHNRDSLMFKEQEVILGKMSETAKECSDWYNLVVGIDLVGDELGLPYCPFVTKEFIEFVEESRKHNTRFGVRIHCGENIPLIPRDMKTRSMFVVHLYICMCALSFLHFKLKRHIRVGHGVRFAEFLTRKEENSFRFRKSEVLFNQAKEELEKLKSSVPFEINLTSNEYLLHNQAGTLVDSYVSIKALKIFQENSISCILSTDDDGIWDIQSCKSSFREHRYHKSLAAEFCNAILLNCFPDNSSLEKVITNGKDHQFYSAAHLTEFNSSSVNIMPGYHNLWERIAIRDKEESNQSEPRLIQLTEIACEIINTLKKIQSPSTVEELCNRIKKNNPDILAPIEGENDMRFLKAIKAVYDNLVQFNSQGYVVFNVLGGGNERKHIVFLSESLPKEYQTHFIDGLIDQPSFRLLPLLIDKIWERSMNDNLDKDIQAIIHSFSEIPFKFDESYVSYMNENFNGPPIGIRHFSSLKKETSVDDIFWKTKIKFAQNIDPLNSRVKIDGGRNLSENARCIVICKNSEAATAAVEYVIESSLQKVSIDVVEYPSQETQLFMIPSYLEPIILSSEDISHNIWKQLSLQAKESLLLFECKLFELNSSSVSFLVMRNSVELHPNPKAKKKYPYIVSDAWLDGNSLYCLNITDIKKLANNDNYGQVYGSMICRKFVEPIQISEYEGLFKTIEEIMKPKASLSSSLMNEKIGSSGKSMKSVIIGVFVKAYKMFCQKAWEIGKVTYWINMMDSSIQRIYNQLDEDIKKQFAKIVLGVVNKDGDIENKSSPSYFVKRSTKIQSFLNKLKATLAEPSSSPQSLNLSQVGDAGQESSFSMDSLNESFQ